MRLLREASDDARRGEVRPNGILVLIVIVIVGLGSGAAYLQYKRPQLKAQYEERMASAPSTAEGRLALWHEYGASQIHHRLTEVARFSAEHPWLVTHAVRVDPDTAAPLEVWGVDTGLLPRSLSHVEGMRVLVELPSPTALGRMQLTGEKGRHVPVYAADATVPDPDQRLELVARAYLERLPEALEKDIEGARLEFIVGAGPRSSEPTQPGADSGR